MCIRDRDDSLLGDGQAAESGEWREAKNGLKEIYKAFDGFKKQYGSDWDAIHKAALKWYRELADSDPAKDHAHYNFMDELGVFFAGDISGPNYGQYRYDIPHPVTRKPVKEPASGWRFPEETMRQRIADSLVVFGEDETTVPKNKVYLKDNETQSLVSVKYKDGRAATKALKNLLGGDYFTNPKNVDVISDLIQSVTGEKDIIMDFFSGSGTTAQSVMSVNAKRHKKLSFIMVQIPEQIDPKDKAKTSKEAYKAGFRTIDEIGRERIKRAAAKIKEETGADIDYGFKLVRLESPSVKTLDELDSFTPDPAEVIAGDYVSKFDLDGTSGREVVLTTWLNQDGFGLLAKPRKVELADYVLDVCEDSAYIIDTGISSEDVQELVRLLETNELQLSRVVVFPYSVTFSLMHELKKNLSVLKSGQSVEVIERF